MESEEEQHGRGRVTTHKMLSSAGVAQFQLHYREHLHREWAREYLAQPIIRHVTSRLLSFALEYCTVLL